MLTGETLIKHGKAVATATPYLPGLFDRPPRDPALKISSGYKAWEFLMYMYGLGPGVFYNILPTLYYENFCDLIYGMQIINQHKITSTQLLQAKDALKWFARGFEVNAEWIVSISSDRVFTNAYILHGRLLGLDRL